MLFSSIGSIYGFMKSTELTMKWQQRSNDYNPYRKGEEDDPERKSLRDSAESVRKGNIAYALNARLNAGSELTSDELAYLKANHPQLYQEAMELKQERAAYKKELEECETKDEVDELKSRKMQQFLAAAKTIQNNPSLPEGAKKAQLEKILKRVMNIQSEHVTFIKSKEYADLPRKAELEENEKERKKDTDSPADEVESEGPSADPDFEDLRRELTKVTGKNNADEKPVKKASPKQEEVKIYTAKGDAKPVEVKQAQKLTVKA